MRRLIVVLLVAKVGFIANESVTGLKLLEKGFSKEDLALAVLIDFPFQLLVGYYAAKWSNGPQPLKPVSDHITFCNLIYYIFYILTNFFIVDWSILWSISFCRCWNVSCILIPD
jgi:hypothetical protein